MSHVTFLIITNISRNNYVAGRVRTRNKLFLVIFKSTTVVSIPLYQFIFWQTCSLRFTFGFLNFLIVTF